MENSVLAHVKAMQIDARSGRGRDIFTLLGLRGGRIRMIMGGFASVVCRGPRVRWELGSVKMGMWNTTRYDERGERNERRRTYGDERKRKTRIRRDQILLSLLSLNRERSEVLGMTGTRLSKQRSGGLFGLGQRRRGTGETGPYRRFHAWLAGGAAVGARDL